MASVQSEDIIKYMRHIDICKRCCVRLLNVDVKLINYENIDEEFLLFREDYKPNAKKKKANPCPVCLDVLSDETFEKLLNPTLFQGVRDYDSDTYSLHISTPDCIVSRQHCMARHLTEVFPNYPTKLAFLRSQLGQVFRASVIKRLDALLGKQHADNAELKVMVTFHYTLNEQELSKLFVLDKQRYFNRLKNKDRYTGRVYTKKELLRTLHSLSSDVLRKNFLMPPATPGEGVELAETVEIHQDPVFIVGRFIKHNPFLPIFSSQDSSVMVIIKDYFKTVFKIDETQIEYRTLNAYIEHFRCLGTGRIFYIKIEDSKKSKITFEEFRFYEKAINETHHGKGFMIKDLQLGDKQTSKNFCAYRDEALRHCYLHVQSQSTVLSVDDIVNRINKIPMPLLIQQKNRFPYIHTTDFMNRVIKKMSATKQLDSEDMFAVKLEHAPGFFEADFITGKEVFTRPCLTFLINAKLQLISVDYIEDYHIWPPVVPSQPLKVETLSRMDDPLPQELKNNGSNVENKKKIKLLRRDIHQFSNNEIKSESSNIAQITNTEVKTEIPDECKVS